MGHHHLRDVWKYAGEVCGLQYVILPGITLLHELFVGNWDTQ